MDDRFYLISLGCPKNRVDSEVVYGTLEMHGWRGTNSPETARVLLVNTCGFIQPAVEESIEEILQLLPYKDADPSVKLVVIGCLVQRYRKKLEQELPEVDLFVGTEAVADIHLLLDGLKNKSGAEKTVITDRYLMDVDTPRKLSAPFFRALMKITEGCDNHCSYCLIPSIRGTLRSRTIDDLVREAQLLEERGVKEISFVAQDLTAYGRDQGGDTNLVLLLKAILAETSLEWLRLLYLYPTGIDDPLLELLSTSSRIVPYLDIPLQHISDKMLKSMNRRYTREEVRQLLVKLRSSIPDIALRTTFLVGFPGETEEDFAQLEAFIREARFDHVGIFTYANEEGCPAEQFPDQLEETLKQERRQKVMQIQSEVSAEILRKYVGRTEPVLVEGVSEETDLLLAGRTRFQAPEIDGCVLINDGIARPGEIVDVAITEAQVYDLVGRIV